MLLALHEGQFATEIETGESFTTYNVLDYLREETGLDTEEINHAMDYSNAFGLGEKSSMSLEEDREDEWQGGITRKGFEVAHERELAKRQDRTNRALMLVTGVLALSALLGLMPSTWIFPSVVEHLVVAVLVVALLGLLFEVADVRL